MQKKEGSIQHKIFLSITLTIIIFVCIFTATITLYSAFVIKKDATSFMEANLSSLSYQLEEIHSRIVSALFRVTLNNEIRSLLAEDYSDASYEEYEKREKITAILANYIASESYIEGLSIVTSNPSYFSTLDSIALSRDGEKLANQLDTILPDEFFFIGEELFVYRPVYKGAYAIAKINLEALNSSFSYLAMGKSNIFAFVFQGEKIIGFPPEDLSAKDFIIEENMLITETNKYFMRADSLFELGITVVNLVEHREFISELIVLVIIASVCILISLISSLTLAAIISKLVGKNIRELRISMLKISNGDIRERVPELPDRELRDLGHIFNTMMDRVQDLLNDNAKKEFEKKLIEQDYLNAQIKPHFIYNTLNSIKYTAHERGDMELEEIAGAVIELLRSVIGKNDREVDLCKEVELAEEYVKIHNYKTKSSIRLAKDIDDSIKDFKVPILILQPLVENACLHGMENRHTGEIHIKAEKEGNKIVINVSDDGVGFDLKDYKNKMFFGIGLSNVFERLKLIYGDDFSFNLSSDKNNGTDVELKLNVQSIDCR